MIVRDRTAALPPPHRALWEITRRCDLRCEHCLVRGGERTEELDAAAAMDLVNQLADLGVSAVSLTGGEPLVRKDWREIAARIRGRGMGLRFSSNGHLVDDRVAGEIADLGAENFTVSVDGTPETHDRLRHGAGRKRRSSFARVVSAIDSLRTHGVSVHVITSVSRQNLDDLPAIHERLKRHGVSVWIVQLAHRTGRLAPSRDGAQCDPIAPADLPRVSRFIVERAGDPVLAPRAFHTVGYLGRDEPILRQSGHAQRRPFWQGCTCGVNTIGIEPDGGVKGCANQVGAPFIVGNVRTEPLRTIWDDRRRWHWLAATPEDMTGDCAGCALSRICRAGCPALAFAATGELYNNPYCMRRIERGSAEAGA